MVVEEGEGEKRRRRRRRSKEDPIVGWKKKSKQGERKGG
jgi:hypothetical protein